LSRQQEVEVKAAALNASQSELKTVINAYKTKEQGYEKRLEEVEIARATAARKEAAGTTHPACFPDHSHRSTSLH
jgi:peptidoglycan hydrolase CwlO-like protein